MAIWQGRSKRKPSGGKYKSFRKKRKREIGSDPVYTKLSEQETKRQKRVMSGDKITCLLTATHANVSIKGQSKKVKILAIKENQANRHFVRMNVITKGAIIETEAGLAKVISRPTREGVVNAVLLKE